MVQSGGEAALIGPSEDTAGATSYCTNTICELQGLKAANALNGTLVIIRCFDSDAGRYVCDRLYSAAGPRATALKVKEANLSSLGPVQFTLEEVQKWVDNCPPNMALSLPKGDFTVDGSPPAASGKDSDDEASDAGESGGGGQGDLHEQPVCVDGESCLVVTHAITLRGISQEETKLHFSKFRFLGETEGVGRLTIADIRLLGSVEILGSELKQCTLQNVTINCSANQGECVPDALHLNKTSQEEYRRQGCSPYLCTVLLHECTIRGGTDGVQVDCPACTFHKCMITEVRRYGMSVSEEKDIPEVIAKDCIIDSCGEWGVEAWVGAPTPGQSKLTRFGRNHIQPGPRDTQPYFGFYELEPDNDAWWVQHCENKVKYSKP
ncbi:unnamed protein product [Amoebophrya sp. A120]|nr:unnamed protein product [Amoebophrya sp. A120]|eukprot:GSA120T00018453001.1